ncbi:MAG: hypothetical protein J5710_14205 [Treponema sp.]|nr:hypothetical protein [Treponema sp.]
MQEFNIVGKTTVTAEVKAQVDNSPLALPPPQGMGTVDDFQLFTEAQNESTDSMKQYTSLMKEFGNVMPDIIKQLRAMNDAVARTNQNLPAIGKVKTSEEQKKQRIEDLNRQNLLGIANNGSNLVQSYANGNVSGMALTGVNAVANTSNNLSKMAEAADMTNLAKDLVAGGVVAAIVGAVIKGGDVLAEKFIQEMPVVYGSGRSFGSMNDFDSMVTWQKINEYNKNTNLDIDTFQGLAQSLRKQGLGNGLTTNEQLSVVGNIAQATSRWAYATGGSADQYAQLAGTMARYGGSKDVVGDFNYLVAAGKASGLNDTQIPEFLSGIQKVMEEGIAKGFTRSATDVADTLLMFSKMSGNNAFWQGEQGARLLNQANNGLSSAVGLSKTSDILAYNAIVQAYSTPEAQEAALGSDLFLKNGNYVNSMMLLEQGLNKNNFGALMGAIQAAEPDNTDAQIERIREMFGVNYSDASRILQLYSSKGGKVTDTDITNVTEAPEYQNKETRYQQAVNDIKSAVVNIGAGAAELKIKGMETIANGVGKIEKWLGMDYEQRYNEYETENTINEMTDVQKALLMVNTMYNPKLVDTDEELNLIAGWNGVGLVSGMENNAIVKDYTGSKVADEALYGYSKEGAVELTHRIGRNDYGEQNLYLRMLYGQDILDMAGGDMDLYNNLLNSYIGNGDLSKKDPLYKLVSELRGQIDFETADKVVYEADREKGKTRNLLQQIVDELKNISITENR